MTLPSLTSTSTSQYSAETLMTILERPSTSLSQSVDVIMDNPDPEVILPGKLRTVATRLCDPLAITLPLHHSTPLEPPIVPMKHQLVLVPSIFHLFLASLQVHQFYHLKYHSHSLHFPVYRKLSLTANRTVPPLQKFSIVYCNKQIVLSCPLTKIMRLYRV